MVTLQARHTRAFRRDLQLMLLLPCLLLLVHHAAAQQAHVQLRTVVLGGFVTLREESGTLLAGFCRGGGRQAGQGPLRSWTKRWVPCWLRQNCKPQPSAEFGCQHQVLQELICVSLKPPPLQLSGPACKQL